MKLKPNYNISLFVLLLFITTSVSAQQVIPLPTDRGDNLSVFLDNIQFTSITQSNSYGLQFRFVVMGGKLPRQERILIRPQLTQGDSIAAFPPVEIDGQWVYYHQVRSGIEPTGIHYRAKDAATHQQYSGVVAAANWMQKASLSFSIERVNACGDVLSSSPYFYRAPTPEFHTYREDDVRHEEVMHLQGRSYVSFPSGSVEVLADFGNNQSELARLCHTIDSVSKDSDVDILSIRVTGYASPEGSFVKNDQIASRRTHSLTRYIIDATNISSKLFQTAHVAEDWDGLRTFVDSTAMLANRKALLQIIDSDRDPDDKLTYIQKRFPGDYAKLKDFAFPLLRHTDYQIDYIHKNVTRSLGKLHTDTIYRLHADTLATGTLTEVTPEPYRTYRPLLAIKTNLLFDAILAPNVEIEVPFGKEDKRWSVMAEVWCPWWRFDHNAAGEQHKYYRSDQRPTRTSYQLLAVGVEARRWFAGKRCPEARPLLTGPFVGLYAAGGKYDLGRNGKGDQGEYFSVGLSAGYSWPIARHWNLELSAAVGYVGGPKVHYENEFDDARLIYRNDTHLNYVGPTKLKLSLVYLIGKKGGGL